MQQKELESCSFKPNIAASQKKHAYPLEQVSTSHTVGGQSVREFEKFYEDMVTRPLGSKQKKHQEALSK